MKKITSRILIIMACLICMPALHAFTTTPSERLHVWFDDFSIDPDGKTVAYLKVYENDTINYSAFNMTFYVPKGLKIHQIKKGRDTVDDIEMSARAASTHSIACNLLDDGVTLRVIATSSQNDDLYPDDEEGNPLDYLYRIGLVADETMNPGTYPIEMTGIKFVIVTGDACVPADDHVYGTVTVTGEPNPPVSVDEIEVADIEGVCYDLQGRVVNNPEPGMIMICNGRKIMVK